MFTRLIRSPFYIGGLSIFSLITIAALTLFIPKADSASRNDAPVDIILQTPTDNIFRLSIAANEIIYNPNDQSIYASRPSSAGNNGNSISRINPLTGEIGSSVYIGSEPNKLAISNDGQTLYATLDGAFSIRRFNTVTQTAGVQFPIGRGQSVNANDAPYLASDIAVDPNNPNVLAVSRYKPGISPPGAGVAVFDNGVQRPSTGPGHSDAANFIDYSNSSATLYGGGYDGGLRAMTIDANGVTDTGNQSPFYVKNLKFENNLVFDSTGQVINPQTRTLLGTFPGVNTSYANAFVPDTATNRAFYAVTSNQNIIIKAFDINTFAEIGSLTVPNVGYDVYATTLIRYGSNGLAMRTTNNQIYFIQTALIPTDNPLPVPSVTPNNSPTPTPTVYSKFARRVTLPNRDLIYRAANQKFYVSVPSTAASPRANSVTRIEPTTAAVEDSVFVGSEPNRLAFTDDEQIMYIGIDGTNAVRKFDMQTQTPGSQFSLGMGVNGPKRAYDIDVLPGSQNSVVVSYGNTSYNYDGADIYDNGVKRAQKADNSGQINIASADTLYVGEYYISKYSISANGLSLQTRFTTSSGGDSIINGNLLYAAGGGVIDLSNLNYLGSFTGVGNRPGLTVDTANNRIFFLTQEGFGSSEWSIKAFRLDNFLPIGSIPLPGVVISTSYPESPHRLIRWGENGLAFHDGIDQIYFIQSNLISSNGTVPTAVHLAAQTYESNESAGNLQVTVTRSGGLTGTTTVDYATQDGTATAGSDYTAAAGSVTFAPGEVNKTISIPIINDNVYEGNESFNFLIANGRGEGTVEIQSPNSAVLTIADNDSQPLGSAPNIPVSEPRISGTSTALFTVQLTNPTIHTVTVNYATANITATAGSDYLPVSGSLTFAPLETTKTIAVQVLADGNFNEPNETFRMVFSNGVNTYFPNSQGTATIINYNPQTARHSYFDYDDDGKTDIGIYRPGGGEWWINSSQTNQVLSVQFGSETDKITSADFTGDGKTDIAFWRPSTGQWFVLRSEDFSFYGFPFGSSGDVPVSADFDGDGRADAAVFRPSNSGWYIMKASGGIEFLTFGANGDSPVVADYDGDRKADIAITRINGTSREWWIRRSSNGQVFSASFGESTDKAVQGDYTGDGKADIAFWRPSNGFWYILRSEDFSYYGFPFGSPEDTPAPGDFDGDGKFDASVFRQSNSGWYQLRTTQGFTALTFGSSGDIPVSSAFIP